MRFYLAREKLVVLTLRLRNQHARTYDAEKRSSPARSAASMRMAEPRCATACSPAWVSSSSATNRRAAAYQWARSAQGQPRITGCRAFANGSLVFIDHAVCDFPCYARKIAHSSNGKYRGEEVGTRV